MENNMNRRVQSVSSLRTCHIYGVEQELRRRDRKPLLAVVVPCHNEEEVLPATNSQLTQLLRNMRSRDLLAEDSYVLYVDDGSTDRTWSIIERLAEGEEKVGGLRLSCNSGQQAALLAGIEIGARDADAIVTIDADLQDDPAAIEVMVREYMRGYDVVYGVRESRETDSLSKRSHAEAFYMVMSKLGVRTVFNHGDYRLLSRCAVDALLSYGERNVFLRGLVPMMGFQQSAVYFARRRREAGTTKYPVGRMVNFAIDGITSFSVRPVRMVFAMGLLFLLIALGILVFVLARYFTDQTIEGWSSLMLSIWFCAGMVLVALGVIGEYVGKIYTEAKGRPLYHIDREIIPASDGSSDRARREEPRREIRST